LVADLNKLVKGNPNLLSMSSQLVGLLAASTQSGADGDSLKTGAWVAQNGTQYNFGDHLPPGLAAYGQAATTQMEYMQKQGASSEELSAAGQALARGEGFEGVQPATEFVKAWGEFMAAELSGLGLVAILGKASPWFAFGTKGLGAFVDDTIKALPAPRQIDASWSASTYNKGGLMTGIEHVFYRHGPDSGFADVSKFSQGTSVKNISSYVDSALRYGNVTPNGPSGHVIEYNTGKVIGTSVSGAPTSTIKINVRDGIIKTAFPY
jgi:hypothetical protein